MSNIELVRIDENNFMQAFNLKLAKEQEQFVSNPIRSLAQAYECFLLGKHTVERVCSGLSPLRRDRLWC